jgi:hypothetical protein
VIDGLASLISEGEDVLYLTQQTPYIQEFFPSTGICRIITLLGSYQRKLKAGETYQLRWRGREFYMWDWGTKADHVGQVLNSCRL